MLTALLKATEKKVIGEETRKIDGPFVCQGCLGDVIFKKGKIRAPHFSHEPNFVCRWDRGDSTEHKRYTLMLNRALVDNGYVTEVNPIVGNRKANDSIMGDIKVNINGYNVIIELLRNSIPKSKIISRTLYYNKFGYLVLWISLNGKNNRKYYRVNKNELYLSEFFSGKIFFANRFNPMMLRPGKLVPLTVKGKTKYNLVFGAQVRIDALSKQHREINVRRRRMLTKADLFSMKNPLFTRHS